MPAGTAIGDYLKTNDTAIAKLLALTKKGKYLNIDDNIEIALQGAWELPGMARLKCKENGKFAFAWLDLWNAVINMLCFKEREKQDIGGVNRTLNDFLIDSHEHEDCRQEKPVHEIHTNQKLKHMEVTKVCKCMQMPERTPDNYSRAIIFLAAVGDQTFNKLERILEDADDITDADMTYERTVKLCLLAESRLKKRVSALTMARQIRKASETGNNKKKEPLPEPKDIKKGDQRTPAPKKDAKETGTKYLDVPDKFKNLTKEQSEALSTKCLETGFCKNCAEFCGKYPSHRSYQCPYKSR